MTVIQLRVDDQVQHEDLQLVLFDLFEKIYKGIDQLRDYHFTVSKAQSEIEKPYRELQTIVQALVEIEEGLNECGQICRRHPNLRDLVFEVDKMVTSVEPLIQPVKDVRDAFEQLKNASGDGVSSVTDGAWSWIAAQAAQVRDTYNSTIRSEIPLAKQSVEDAMAWMNRLPVHLSRGLIEELQELVPEKLTKVDLVSNSPAFQQFVDRLSIRVRGINYAVENLHRGEFWKYVGQHLQPVMPTFVDFASAVVELIECRGQGSSELMSSQIDKVLQAQGVYNRRLFGEGKLLAVVDRVDEQLDLAYHVGRICEIIDQLKKVDLNRVVDADSGSATEAAGESIKQVHEWHDLIYYHLAALQFLSETDGGSRERVLATDNRLDPLLSRLGEFVDRTFLLVNDDALDTYSNLQAITADWAQVERELQKDVGFSLFS